MAFKKFVLSLFLVVSCMGNSATALELPKRQTPVPQTTNGVPHVQIGVEPNQALNAELLRRVANIKGIEVKDTIISLPGALGFFVTRDVPLARPEVIVRGREFAHIHPDGSLHASLEPELAAEAARLGWAVPHPWANRRRGWEGFVMIFTASTADEVDTVFELVKASFEYVTDTSAVAR